MDFINVVIGGIGAAFFWTCVTLVAKFSMKLED